jgi:hypothetical protein
VEVWIIELVDFLVEDAELTIPSIFDGAGYFYRFFAVDLEYLYNMIGRSIGHESTLCNSLTIPGFCDDCKLYFARSGLKG